MYSRRNWKALGIKTLIKTCWLFIRFDLPLYNGAGTSFITNCIILSFFNKLQQMSRRWHLNGVLESLILLGSSCPNV